MSVDFTLHAEAVGRHYFGEPNARMSKPGVELRFGANGSIKIDLRNATWFDFEQDEGGGLLDLIKLREGYTEDGECFEFLRAIGRDVPEPEGGGRRAKGRAREGRGRAENSKSEPAPKNERTIEAIYDYLDADGALLFQVVRFQPKTFVQRRPMPGGGFAWGLTEGIYGRFREDGDWYKVKKDRQYRETRELAALDVLPYRLPAVLAAVAEGREVHFVEGEKDVATLEAFGMVATCNPGGTGKWRAEYGDWFKGADVVVHADNDDAGRKHADEICGLLRPHAARLRRVDLVEAQPALREKGDVTDWVAEHGGTAELLTEIVAGAPDWTPRAPDPGFPVFRFGDLISYRPQEEWLVDGWLGAGQLGVLYGKPKSGKSFIALDMGMHLAHGWPWLDSVDVQQGGVFYIAAEGGDGVKKRVAAWAAEYPQRRGDAPFFMAPHRFDLFDGEKAVTEIAGYLRAAAGALDVTFRLIVVDTLARVFGGGDENFAGDMNRIIESCDRLRAETGCAVLIVHHSAKADGAGMRGSSALYGAVDAVWESRPMEDEEKNEIPNLKTLTLRDQKDGEAGASHTVALRQRVLGIDDAGRPATSCIVEPVQDSSRSVRPSGTSHSPSHQAAQTARDPEPRRDVGAPEGRRRESSQDKDVDPASLDAAYAALEAATARHGEETPQGKAVEGSVWASVYSSGTWEPKATAKARKQIESGMAALKAVAKALIEQGRALRVQVGDRTLYAINDCPF